MTERRTRRGTVHFLLLGINAGIFALVAAVAALVLIIPAVTGSVALTVLTSSMEPGLPPGSLVVVKPTDPADVRIGSIITFQWESGNATLVTHRVIGVTTDADGRYEFMTQGDNNDAPDPNPVTQEQVQGVVWYSLPLLGWVSNLMAGDLRPFLVPVFAAALLIYAAVLVVQSIRGKRGVGAAPAVSDPDAQTEADAGADPGADAALRARQRDRGARARGRRALDGTTDRRANALAAAEPHTAPAAAEATAVPIDRSAKRSSMFGAVLGRAAEPEPGPRRSTYIAPAEADRGGGHRARRAAERAAAEGLGTGLGTFIDPPPQPEPPQPEPPQPEPPHSGSAEERSPDAPRAPRTRREALGRAPAPERRADDRRPRGKGRSYR